MCHGEHADNVVSGMNEFQVVVGKFCIGPETAVGQHRTFGAVGGARSIVDHRQLLWLFGTEKDVVDEETPGIFFCKVICRGGCKLLQMLVTACQQREGVE